MKELDQIIKALKLRKQNKLSKRSRYDQKTIGLVLNYLESSKLNIDQLSFKIGVPHQTIRGWVKRSKINSGKDIRVTHWSSSGSVKSKVYKLTFNDGSYVDNLSLSDLKALKPAS